MSNKRANIYFAIIFIAFAGYLFYKNWLPLKTRYYDSQVKGNEARIDLEIMRDIEKKEKGGDGLTDHENYVYTRSAAVVDKVRQKEAATQPR